MEVSRRMQWETPNPLFRYYNCIADFRPVEIVDRAASRNQYNPTFRTVYVSVEDHEMLLRRLRSGDNISGRVFMDVQPVNRWLRRYAIESVDVTRDLCNYPLVR